MLCDVGMPVITKRRGFVCVGGGGGGGGAIVA